MTILRILQYPDPRLRTKAALVKDVNDARIKQIIEDMLETLRNAKHCAGLSATQLDIQDPPSITVINDEKGGDPICLLNPKIVHAEGSSREEEGCMSVSPGDISGFVTRAEKVRVEAIDRFGKPVVIETGGFFAKVLQHETDHLNGVLFIDRVSPLKRKMIDRKIAKLNAAVNG